MLSRTLMAVQLINEEVVGDNANQALVLDYRSLLRRTQSILTHIFRETNRSADHMARLGAEQQEGLVVTKDSPQSVRHFVLEDGLGVAHLRD